MGSPLGYSTQSRMEYLETHLTGKFRWESLEDKGRHGYSYREIAQDVARHFQLPKPPSPATIALDIRKLREIAKLPDEAQLSEARALLAPERFSEWRARFFRDPATGKPYQTPRHQQAWFDVFRALAFKEPVSKATETYLALPGDINDKILSGEHLVSLLLLAPPRHGKTDLMLHAIIWAICRDPSIRIIYCSGISTISRDNAAYVRSELEHNEELVRMYGPFKSDETKWASDGFIVAGRTAQAKSPTMLPIGRGTTVLSRDADIIIVDDPQDIDAAESEAQTDRDFSWLTTQVMTRREPHTALLLIGSHLPSATGDLWLRVLEHADELSTGRHTLVTVKTRAHDYERCDPINDPEHELCVLWHDLRPFWFLEAQRAAMGDVLFETCYNQDVRASRVSYFDQDLIRLPRPAGWQDEGASWKQVGTCCGLKRLTVLGFDPAAGETRHAAESALCVVAGCRKCDDVVLVDYWHARVSPETHADTILSFVRSYRVSRVRIEINAYQKALARDPKLVKAQAGLGFVIDPWLTDDRKNDPILGIPLLERRMREGTLRCPAATQADRAFSEDLLKSFIRWPKRPNDIPMAVWLAVGCWSELYKEYSANTPDVIDGWELLPDHLREQTVEVDLSLLAGSSNDH